MISCKEGHCKIDGNVDVIDVDLAVLIHAIDITYSEKFGKEYAFKHIKRCYEVAMEIRDEECDSEPIAKSTSLEKLEKLKKINSLLNMIIKEVEYDGSAE